jgi:hypothetical protein
LHPPALMVAVDQPRLVHGGHARVFQRDLNDEHAVLAKGEFLSMWNVGNKTMPKQVCCVVRTIALSQLLRYEIVTIDPGFLKILTSIFVPNNVASGDDIGLLRPRNGKLPIVCALRHAVI